MSAIEVIVKRHPFFWSPYCPTCGKRMSNIFYPDSLDKSERFMESFYYCVKEKKFWGSYTSALLRLEEILKPDELFKIKKVESK